MKLVALFFLSSLAMICNVAYAAPEETLSPYDLVGKINLRQGMNANFTVTTISRQGKKKDWPVLCNAGEFPLVTKIDPETNSSPMCNGWEAWLLLDYKKIYVTDLSIR